MPVQIISDDPAHRGQFRRETGFGRITKLDPKGRNTQVSIDAEHLGDPVTGWADAQDGALMARIGDAHANARRVAYIIDTTRKASVDVDTPLDKLGNREKVREVMDVYVVDANGVPVDGYKPGATSSPTPPPAQPRTEPEQPPADGPSGGRSRTLDRAGVTAGTPAALTCPRCGHPRGTLPLVKNPDGPGLVHAECPTVDGPVDHDEHAAHAAEEAAADAGPVIGAGTGPDAAQDVHEPGPATDGPAPAEEAPTPPPAARTPLRPPSPTSGRRQGPRLEEAKPWVAYNTDGSVNLGSYGYTAALGMTEFAAELIVARARTDASTLGVELAAPKAGAVQVLARWLLNAADAVQANIRSDHRVDRMDNSHTRARGAIRDALDLYPVPWGATDEQRLAWRDDLVAYGTMLLEVALAVLDPELDEPAATGEEAGR